MADMGCTDEKHSTYSKTIVPQLHWEPVQDSKGTEAGKELGQGNK